MSAGLALEQREKPATPDGIDSRVVDLVALVVESSQRMHSLVNDDRERLEQVVINLLSNAHKYSPAGSQVEIRVMRSSGPSSQQPEEWTGNECLIAVRSNGPGIPQEERERIFERFYRSSLHHTDRTARTAHRPQSSRGASRAGVDGACTGWR